MYLLIGAFLTIINTSERNQTAASELYCFRASCFLITNSYLKHSGVCDEEWAAHTHTHTHTHTHPRWLCVIGVCVCGQALCCVQGRGCRSGSFLWAEDEEDVCCSLTAAGFLSRGPFLTFCWFHGVTVSRHVCHLNQNQNQNLLLLLLIIRLTHFCCLNRPW